MTCLAVIMFPDGIESMRKPHPDLLAAKLWIKNKLMVFNARQLELNIDLEYPFGFTYAVFENNTIIYENAKESDE